MKHKKSQGGFTLVELTVVIALLTIITVGITGVIFAAHKSYQTNEEKLKDEYNARNALVFITREIHSDTYEAKVPDDDDSKLILTSIYDNDKRIVFYLDNGVLKCDSPIDYDVSFPADKLELESFKANVIQGKDGKDRRVELSIEGKYGLKLETSVALLRTQPGEDPPDEEDDE